MEKSAVKRFALDLTQSVKCNARQDLIDSTTLCLPSVSDKKQSALNDNLVTRSLYKANICLFTILALFVGFSLLAGVMGYRINRTASHPIGIYRIVDREPAVGLYAQFCAPTKLANLPPTDQIYVPICTKDTDGHPLLKRIVYIDQDNYYVEGDDIRSLDSRIFGPINKSDITHILIPVWVHSQQLTLTQKPV